MLKLLLYLYENKLYIRLARDSCILSILNSFIVQWTQFYPICMFYFMYILYVYLICILCMCVISYMYLLFLHSSHILVAFSVRQYQGEFVLPYKFCLPLAPNSDFKTLFVFIPYFLRLFSISRFSFGHLKEFPQVSTHLMDTRCYHCKWKFQLNNERPSQ